MTAPQGRAASSEHWEPVPPTHTCRSSPSRGLSRVTIPWPLSAATPSFLSVARYGELHLPPLGAKMKPRARVLSCGESPSLAMSDFWPWVISHHPPAASNLDLTSGPGTGSPDQERAQKPVCLGPCLGGFQLSFVGFPQAHPLASKYKESVSWGPSLWTVF